MHNNAKQMVENRYGFISKGKCVGIFIFSCLPQLSRATTFLNYNVMRLLSNIFKLSEETGSSMPDSKARGLVCRSLNKVGGGPPVESQTRSVQFNQSFSQSVVHSEELRFLYFPV